MTKNNTYLASKPRYEILDGLRGVAGVLMTLFVLMLWKKRTRKYQLMALILGAAIILFTYIPGISAKSIGLSCQKQRLSLLISNLKLADAKTGKLSDDIDIRRIKQDSLLCKKTMWLYNNR